MSGLFGLDDQVAVVIGGTGVLGGAICHGLAEAGAAVAVLGRSLERANDRVAAIEAAGGHAVAVLVDSTSPDSAEAARQEVERLIGPVDVLVNAAGVNSSTPFLEIDVEEWHTILDADLTAVFVACQVFGRAMIERGTAASIINISSASSGPPLSRVLAYSVAKAGVNSLTQSLALAEQNRALLSEERIRSIIGHTPARRLGEPYELCGTVVWLASAAASGFVTGAIIRVDGGFSAMTI